MLKQIASNVNKVIQGETTYYYSYNTCVAFHTPNHGLITSKNIWSRTTGRHLGIIRQDNTIGKQREVSNEEFNKMMKEL